ncbi:MAG TPA: tetratricopeptide repeat protein [Solirubrobacteraceae bacterium]|jgi:tetratricopeptide (TPR) repeat protein
MKVADVALLWGRAAGRCSAPDCGIELTLEMPNAGRFIVGEHAHIIPRSPRGPRGDGRHAGSDSYENRVLLCPTHHRIADRAPDDHPREVLLAWKTSHEERVRARAMPMSGGPVVWDVPHPLNRRLAGRDEMLHEIGERLREHPVQALYGLSGIGKTQLAVTFAYRQARDYRVVYWVDASSGAILRGLRAFAADVGIELDDDLSAGHQAIRAFLAERDDYLLIFDRAPDASALEPWLPEDPAGHILITSTSPAWRRLGHPQRVPPLDETIGADYLKTRTGDARGGALVRRLGGLPLALEQAASYVEATGVDLERYLQLFDTAAVELLGTQPQAEDYDATVLVTLSLALDAIDSERHPLAATALRALSYLDAEQLPRRAMMHVLQAAPRAEQALNEIEVDLALGALAARSVVAVDPAHVSMHALVAEVTRRMQPEDPSWILGVQRGLRAALTGDAQLASSFASYAPLVGHVTVACGHAVRLGVADEDTVHLLDRMATHLQQRGFYEQARELFEQALTIDGVPRLVRAGVRLDHSALIDFIDSEEAVRLMHALLEEVGADPTGDLELDTLRADLQQNLALSLHSRGDSERARELIGRARRIHDRVVAEKDRPESKNVIDTVSNDGLIAWAVGDYEHALRAWNETLALAEAAAEPDPLLVARSLSNLGVLYENLERPGDSEDHHRRALELRRKHLPYDHPHVVISLTSLAGAYRAHGKAGNASSFAAALTLDEEAGALAEARGDRLLIGLAVNAQALDRWLSGDVAGALPLALRALEIRRAELSQGHPTLLQALVNLGRIQLANGDPDAAAACFAETLTQWRSSDLPSHHMQVALAHDGLGQVADARGDGREACREFRLALQAFIKLLGPESAAAARAREKVELHCGAGADVA